jgi:hypothetical protein
MNSSLLAGAMLFALPALSQSLPEQWQIIPQTHHLTLGLVEETGLYNRDQIREFFLEFDDPNYWTLLGQYYNTENYVSATLTVDGVVYPQVGVQFRGQTSYMNVQNSEKKSFAIKTDAFIAGQDIDGYNNFNLNNCFGDQSFMREFLYYSIIHRHVPAAKCAYVKLYLNGESWGLYPSVQQLNKDFLEEWYLSNDGSNWRADAGTTTPGGGGPGGGGGPSWGDGTAALNYLGMDATEYQQYYTLKSSSTTDPWGELIETCDVLNNTPLATLPAELPDVLDIDRTLWVLAVENAFADDDSYIYKGKMDYFCHRDVETGRMTIQEYDANSILSGNNLSWPPFYNANNVNYPLLNRIMQIPAWRQRYLAHYRIVLQDLLNPAVVNPILDQYSDMIDAEVQADTKKIYSYTQFVNGVTALQNNVQSRRNTLLNNAEVAQAGPSISSVTASTSQGEWINPLDGEAALVTAAVTAPNGVFEVRLYYSLAWAGNFEMVLMSDDGTGGDVQPGDGEYSAYLPAAGPGTIIRFYIEAVNNNTAKSVSYDPAGAEHDVYYLRVDPVWAEASPIVINEFMASNTSGATDEAGEMEDWIELYNTGSEPVDLTGWHISDSDWNIFKFQIPDGTVLNPDSYLILWADEDQLQGSLHANFKISALGEVIILINANDEISDLVSFGEQQTDMGYARVPNGTGSFVIQQPTFGLNNETPASVSDAGILRSMVYPNPVNDMLQFRVGQGIILRAELVDLTGRVIASYAVNSISGQMECSALAAGSYLLRLVHSNGTEVHQVVKR